MDTKQPIVSVIIPMEDHRGLAVKTVSSWIDQDIDPALYELIIVVRANIGEVKDSIRAMLRPQDRLIEHESDETEQYDIAARAAKSDVLFFTEPHCLASKSLVSEAMDYMQTHDVTGFCLHSRHIASNDVGKMEARFFDEGFLEWAEPNDWRKVILRGFILRKHVYLDVGGFQCRYGRFAEWLLAAHLHESGHMLAYAPDISIAHLEERSLNNLAEHIENFTLGECLYRIEGDAGTVSRYFEQPEEWERTSVLRPEIAKTAFKLSVRHLLNWSGFTGSWRGRALCLWRALSTPITATATKNFPLFRYRFNVWRSKVGFHLSFANDDRKYRNFCAHYMGLVTLYRAKAALEHDAHNAEQSLTTQSYNIAEQTRQNISGFHSPEQHEGTSFRWASTISALKMPALSGNILVEIQLLPTRPMNVERELSIYVGKQLVSDLVYDQENARITFKLVQPVEEWLILLCRPLQSISDKRELALPVVSVNFAQD